MQLHAAAARGEIEAMALALRLGTDVNAVDASGQSALIFALERARTFNHRTKPLITHEALRFLLEAGADLKMTDSLGASAIHYAAAIADTTFLEIILEYGGNPKDVTDSKYSVLTHCCFQPSSEEKRILIKKLHQEGASLDLSSTYGEFPLGVCLRFGDMETMRLLISLGADLEPLNWTSLHRAIALEEISDVQKLNPGPDEINRANLRFGLSPWQLAFIRGDLAIVRWLAEKGADLLQVTRHGESLLHLGARFGHLRTLKWMYDLGGNPNARDDSSSSPLHEASTWDHIECAAALLEFGAYAKSEDHVQLQPIHAAHSLNMIKILAEKGGADINKVDGCGDWPLKLAAENNDVDRVEWLLKKGAIVDQTSTGATALHAAVQNDSRETIHLLLANGADPNQQDVDGWTPLFSAQSIETIGMLRNAGADPSIPDQCGWTAGTWFKDPLLLRALKDRL